MKHCCEKCSIVETTGTLEVSGCTYPYCHCHAQKTLFEQLEKTQEEFDKKFGIANKKELEDMALNDFELHNKGAGCDNCSLSIFVREEHKGFLKQSQLSAVRAFAEEIRLKQPKIIDQEENGMVHSRTESGVILRTLGTRAYDLAIEDLNKKIEDLLSNR